MGQNQHGTSGMGMSANENLAFANLLEYCKEYEVGDETTAALLEPVRDLHLLME